MAQGAGWYSRNSNRCYPLSDAATAVDDEGKQLPEAIIADLKMRFSGSQSDVAYVRHVSVGSAVAVVISVSGTDVAAVTVPYDAIQTPGNTFPLLPLVDGVYGHIGFGNVHTVKPGQWNFQSATQSGLLVSAATPRVRPSNVARLSRAGAEALSAATVSLVGDGDIEVVEAVRELNGVSRSVVLVRLQELASRDTLTEYAGECGKRPESENCGEPSPVESLGLVRPDCCGRVFIELRGCMEMHPLTNGCGVVISCPLTVAEVCPADKEVPDQRGKLPTEFFDICEPATNPVTQQSLVETSRQSIQLTTTTTADPNTTTTTTTTTTADPNAPTTTPSFQRVARTAF